MNIQITGSNGLEVTDAIRAYILKRFERLSSLADRATRFSIVLKIEKLDQIAEANIHISGHDLYAKSSDHVLYAAIDHLHDKIKQQLTKLKDKLDDRKV
jgi:putative sigma-54 modulation protein